MVLTDKTENKCYRYLIENYIDNEKLFELLLEKLPNMDREWHYKDLSYPFDVNLLEFANFLSDFIIELDFDWNDRLRRVQKEIVDEKLPKLVDGNAYINKLIHDLECKNESYQRNIEINNERIQNLRSTLVKDSENDLSSR